MIFSRGINPGRVSLEGSQMSRITKSLGLDGGWARCAWPAGAASSAAPPTENDTIAYALTAARWATYLDPNVPVSCPDGANKGPREQFTLLFPDEGKPRTVKDTQLKREIEYWFPTTAPDEFEFREAGGPIAEGLNLDGKDGPQDFVSPAGEHGIDNQLYRALGCINSYRDYCTARTTN